MKYNFLLFVFFLMAGCLNTEILYAQDGQTEENSDQPRGWLWKGFDVNEVIGENANPEYAEGGRRFYLYNVGTGRFIIEGGNWGMEGRLFHEDFGRPLYLMNTGYIESRITEQSNNNKNVFGCNVPGVSKKGATWADYKRYSFTVLMDVYKPDLTKWNFQRVETNENAETFTYYMWEAMPKRNPKNYYLGAAYGEWHVPEYKGDGYFIYLDDDRSCWTTAEVINNTETVTVNGEQVTIDELYQWRLISEEEFISVLNEEVVGINPSVSSLVPDRDFCRNANGFDENWVMEEKEGADYSGKGRYGYTWGVYSGTSSQKKYNNDEAWNKPVRLKNAFGDLTDYEYGMKNSKYGYLSFEGVGRTYTSFVAPKAGWYAVQCYGFIQSESDHDAYMFAKVAGSTSTDSYGGEAKANLPKVNPDPAYEKDSRDNCLIPGKELTLNGEAYKTTVWICITQEQFESGDISLRTMQVGVGKDLATQSDPIKSGSRTYWYDTDWVCVDDFRVTYMGEGPVFFYEDEEDLDYLVIDPDNPNRQHNQVFADQGHYSGAACLERTLKKGEWNSFSFPLPLTGEQMKAAFGNSAQLAGIHSIGGLSQNPNVIDFKSIDLSTSDYVVQPGQFYLLKPTADPVTGIDPRGKNASWYELGRMFFSINEEETADYTNPKMSVNTWMTGDDGEEAITGESNNGFAFTNYVQTADYENFSVNSDNLYTGEAEVYAPLGAYVVSKNTIYHINKDTRLKGFRGWIVLDHPIPKASELTMAVYGIFDNEEDPTTIGDLPDYYIQLPSDTSVYDLSGRKVGTVGMNLPKGLYIVNGKKFIVK